ncbi:MAG: RDD family protein [Acidimicrobiia bacterium]|jgi:uncharacterized RDD family membrane protein YckC
MVAPYPSVSPAAPAPGGDPTAVFGRRVLAFVIDALLLAVPALLLVTASFEYIQADRVVDGEQYCEEYMDRFGGLCVDASDVNDRIYFSDGVSAAATAVAWGGGFLLAVVLQGLAGWTPGKLVMGLRTVKDDGRPVGIGRAFVRWILMVVDGQPCGLPLVGLITAGTSTGHRRVGDMAARSFVVRASAAGSPIQVPGLAGTAPGYGDAWSPATPPPGASWGPSPTGRPASWDQPVAPTPTPSEPSPPGSISAPPAGGPQWDEARGTYIQWDPAQGRWLQWDEAARRWDVIPGQ